MKLSCLLFIFIFNSFYTQNIDLEKIENNVYENNRLGKQVLSQDLLLKISNDNQLNNKEKAKINILLAETFRSINDYKTAIEYLKKSEELLENIPQTDSLFMDIKLKMAFVFFDNNNYEKSAKYIEYIASKNFRNIENTDKAYLLMQKGYIYFLKKNYTLAMENYNLANKILKIYSPCNQPVVMVKQMQLYGAKNEIDNVEKIYKEISALSDSCNILKYKIYATDEIGKIYKTHHEEQKYFLYNTKLDSLNVLYDREAKLLAMHDKNENYLQDEVENNKTNSLIGIVVFILSTVLLIAIGLFFRKKSSQYKSQKINTEKELIRIKEELKIYSESQFTQKDNENAILNSDKLNKRQKEILKLVAKGLTNKEIGEKLFVTEATVKFHLSNIYSILDVKNRKDILVILSQSNLNPKD